MGRPVWGPALSVHVVEADPPTRSIPAPSPLGMTFVELRSWLTAQVESIEANARRADRLQWHRRCFFVWRVDVRFATPSDTEIQERLFAGLRKWRGASIAEPRHSGVRLRRVCRDSPNRTMSCGDLLYCRLPLPPRLMSRAQAGKEHPWLLAAFSGGGPRHV